MSQERGDFSEEADCMAAIEHHESDGAPRSALLTPAQVADVLGVSTRTVRRLGARGTLARVRLGHRTIRYRPESLETLLLPTTSEAPVITPGLRDNSGEDTADAPERTP